MKIQIMGGKITENLGFESSLQKVKNFLPIFIHFQILHTKMGIFDFNYFFGSLFCYLGIDKTYWKCLFLFSDATSGWAGWTLAHLEFGSSVNPTTTRGADYAQHIIASPPGFENPGASLLRNWIL